MTMLLSIDSTLSTVDKQTTQSLKSRDSILSFIACSISIDLFQGCPYLLTYECLTDFAFYAMKKSGMLFVVALGSVRRI